MTQYLVDLGRKRVGTITGPLDTSGGTERLRGYFDAVGSRKPRSLIVNAKEYSFAAGHAGNAAALEQSPEVDAVFVASDLMAAGALAALRSLRPTRARRHRHRRLRRLRAWRTTTEPPAHHGRASRSTGSPTRWSGCCSTSSRAGRRPRSCSPVEVVRRESA